MSEPDLPPSRLSSRCALRRHRVLQLWALLFTVFGRQPTWKELMAEVRCRYLEQAEVAMKYVRFEEIPNGRHKTRLWWLRTTADNQLVGSVFWKCAWRRYVMSSSEGALWDATCLRDLADFCERQTQARREERRREREEEVR